MRLQASNLNDRMEQPMKNKKSDSFVTNSVFQNETRLLRSELYKETGSIRTEMRSFEERVSLVLIKNQADIKEIKETISTKLATKEDFNTILNHIDASMHRIETYDRKTIVHDARLNDHEARITRLERPA